MWIAAICDFRKKAPRQTVNKLEFLFHLTQSEAAQFN